MAEEMVLIPRVRYERLLNMDTKDVKDNVPIDEEAKAENVQSSPGKVSGGKGGQSSPPTSPLLPSDDKGLAISDDKVEEKKNPPGLRDEKTKEKGEEKEVVNKVKVKTILDEIPSKYRVKAERILAYIDLNGGSIINWNSRGRLVYKNMPISGSSMAELLHHLFSAKGKQIVGFSLFKKGLLKINVPNSLLSKNASTTTSSSPGNKKKVTNVSGKKKKQVNSVNDKDGTLNKKWLTY
jgi:hypothetical protein